MTVTSLDADLSLATPIDLTNDFSDLSDPAEPIDARSAHAMERLARLEATDVDSLRAVSSEIAKELARFSATLDQKQASAVLRIAASFQRVSRAGSLDEVEPMAVGYAHAAGHAQSVAADG
ncbi:MAG: hypothetical protein JST92_20630 [Deltaproteobacteria bacterium]|nr:hypothetical protein [Deltaproteobacteria bacterium]